MSAISVIVPIYNMEKLMRKCIDSLLVQTFRDFELLLIDDGSTDGSWNICKEYEKKDERVHAYHKENGGLSEARNFGLVKAKGEYSIFADPDDWVDADCLADLYTKALEIDADMVICDIYNNDPYRQQYDSQQPTALDSQSLLKDLVVGRIQGYTVNKLIRTSLYKKYHIVYPTGIYGCEDQYTMCSMLLHPLHVAYLPKAYYHYMHYFNNSQSRSYDERTFKMDLHIRDMFYQLLEGNKCQQLAYDYKTSAMVARAFTFGSSVFSSKEFARQFSQYKNVVYTCESSRLMRFFLRLSFAGCYQVAYKVWYGLFRLKQIHKKNVYSLRTHRIHDHI